MNLRPYQEVAAADCIEFFRRAEPGSRRFYSAPTGSGKSYVELAAQAALDDCWIVTPRIEIIEGLLAKLGVNDLKTMEDLIQATWNHKITTPVRFKRALLRGEVEPKFVIVDEGHHDNCETLQDVHALLGHVPAAAFSATAFRSTALGTATLRERWGEPVAIMTYPEAEALGVVSMPECRTVPLVDDDEIEVQSGELVASQVTVATVGRAEAIAELIGKEFEKTRPLMASLPTRDALSVVGLDLSNRDVPWVRVTGETSRADRRAAFEECVSGRAVLLQINVVSEGVDLPIRGLIDAAPSLSPVKWLQQLGRITRPASSKPVYVCTNRNLLRHGYLLEGCLPPTAIREAQDLFGAGGRAAYRVLGLEAIGRFKPAEVKLKDGLVALTYAISALDGHERTDYFCLVHPARAEPLWAVAHHGKNADGTRSWGKWQRAEPPRDLRGFGSLPPRELSPKQEQWWKRTAESRGLDPAQNVTRKNFGVLPVLTDLRIRL